MHAPSLRAGEWMSRSMILSNSFTEGNKIPPSSASFLKKDHSFSVNDVSVENVTFYFGCSPRGQLPFVGLNFVKQIELDREWCR